MNDERLGQEIGEFYRETDIAPPDSKESARQVASRLPHTTQLKHRRWLPDWLQLSASAFALTDTSDDHITGRTRSMLSPTAALTAGAFVFALGGALLIAQPFDEQESAPAAGAEPVAPTWVTGVITAAPSCSAPDLEVDGDVLRYTNSECSPQAWTSSDPRLTGDVIRRYSEDVYTTDDGQFSVSVDTPYLRNEGGGWACQDTNLLRGSQMSSEGVTDTTFSCTGDGGYAGLSAILVSQVSAGFDEEFVGLIFSGDFPPMPDPPAASE